MKWNKTSFEVKKLDSGFKLEIYVWHLWGFYGRLKEQCAFTTLEDLNKSINGAIEAYTGRIKV